MAITDSTIKRLYKTFFVVFVLSIIGYLTYSFYSIIILLGISLLVSLIFEPVVIFLEKQGISRLLSVIIIFAAAGVIIILGFSFLIPKIKRQFDLLGASLNEENINFVLQEIEDFLVFYLPFLKEYDLSSKLIVKVNEFFFNSFNNISSILESIASIVAVLVIVPFMTFFLLKDNSNIIKGIVNLMPNKSFEMSYWVIRKINIQLGRFVSGWIFDAFIVGFLVTIGLASIGIENAFPIGVIAGVGHLIPYFGPVIGGIPAIIISLIQFGDLSMLPYITIVFLVVYTFDNGFIQPNIFSKSTDMHPLLIILLILIGSEAFGIMGMLFAVPIATVVKTAAREIYYGYKNYKIIKL